MSVLELLTWTGAGFSLIALIITIWRTSHDTHKLLPSEINTDELGQIERRITDLCDVFVPCHQVEQPRGSLLEAVEYNMKRGVRYTFLVSQSQYKTEKEKYFRIFHAIAEVVSKTQKEKDLIQIENLVRIRPLRTEWKNYPFVFYKTKEDSKNIEATIVYRGIERDRGICSAYRLVEPELAPTIYALLVNSTDWDTTREELFTLKPDEFISSEQYAREKME
jgi:hypothetical protein